MSEILEMYPRLVVDGADKALGFYTRALGGTVSERFADESGHVMHAMVQAGPAKFAVKDADSVDAAPDGGGPPVIMALYVDDPDAVAARLVDGGAEVLFPVSDHDYGDRSGRLRDPFGHLWMVAKTL
jgi:PhnB protein